MSCSILMGNRWPLKKRVQILGLPWILSGKADFVLLLMAQITRKKINLPKLFSVNYVWAGTSNTLVEIKNSNHIFGSSKCKVTLGFKYTNVSLV